MPGRGRSCAVPLRMAPRQATHAEDRRREQHAVHRTSSEVEDPSEPPCHHQGHAKHQHLSAISLHESNFGNAGRSPLAAPATIPRSDEKRRRPTEPTAADYLPRRAGSSNGPLRGADPSALEEGLIKGGPSSIHRIRRARRRAGSTGGPSRSACASGVLRPTSSLVSRCMECSPDVWGLASDQRARRHGTRMSAANTACSPTAASLYIHRRDGIRTRSSE